MKVIKHMGTGLVATLFLLHLSTVAIIPVHAATVGDFKSSIGLASEKPNNTGNNIYEVIVEDKNSSGEKSETVNDTLQIEQYKLSLQKFEERLEQLFNENAPSKTIVAVIDNIIDAKNKIMQSTTSSTVAGLGSNQSPVEEGSLYDSSYVDIGEEEKITSPDYSIGAIGSECISIVEDYKILVTPWGYTLDEEGQPSKKMVGIDLGTRKGDKIKSQWNGIVTNVSEDIINGGKTVTVFHGNNLYTKYSHVDPFNNITSGAKVTQGDALGTAISTEQSETSKRDHVFYQVILDNNYINPLLIYGNNGKSLYEKWYTSSADVNVVEEGEEYFKTEQAPSYDDYRNNDEAVLYPDFNKQS